MNPDAMWFYDTIAGLASSAKGEIAARDARIAELETALETELKSFQDDAVALRGWALAERQQRDDADPIYIEARGLALCVATRLLDDDEGLE